MTTVELFPADIYNQKTIQQGHPPDWINRDGGEYGLVVLGGAPAGLVSAMTAAAEGHRVAMTEQRLTGGTCVNFGCTPSKALIVALVPFTMQAVTPSSAFDSTARRGQISPQSWSGSVGCVP
jgi:mercuric reductase